MRRVAVVAVLVLSTAFVGGAGAAYPGKNGRIAFLSTRSGEERKLVTMRPDGTGRRIVTEAAGSPAWSGDGRRLAYATHRGQLATIGADGRGRRILRAEGSSPTWSPRNARIAFDTGGGDTIEVIPTGGGAPRRIGGDGPGGNGLNGPSWSPRGDRIAFGAFAVEGSLALSAVWTMRPDG